MFITFSRSTACAFAAASGNLDMLKCLRRQGYPWDDNMGMATGTLVTARAAACGHVETFAWARENGCAYNLASNMWFAVAGGHIEMIEYLIHIRRFPFGSYDMAIPAIALKHGQFHVLEWMWKKPQFVSNFRKVAIEFACQAACDDVIDNERFDAFDWLREAGYEQELTKERNRQTLAREYIHEHYGQYHRQGAPKTKEDYENLTWETCEAKNKGYDFVYSSSDLYYNKLRVLNRTFDYFAGWPKHAGLSRQSLMTPPPKPWNLSIVYPRIWY
jgi:hypothetical protein